MIPLYSDIPIYRRPVIVYGIVLINILVFLYELSLGQGELKGFFLNYGLTSSNASGVTLLTFNFLHGGLLHIVSNMIFLWVFGRNVEDRLGHLAFIFLYIIGGIGAGLLQLKVEPALGIPVIGASGAIAATLGAYLVMFPQARIRTLVILFIFITIITIPAVVMIAIWFLEQLLNGMMALKGANFQQGGIAYWGHIGGFVLGVITTGLLQIGFWRQRTNS